MKGIFLATAVVLLFGKNPVAAQQVLPKVDEQTYLDSLKHLLLTSTSDSVKANTNFFLSDYWRFKDTTKSRQYLEDGKAYIYRNGKFDSQHPFLQGLYFFYEGQFYFNWNARLAADAYLKADSIFEKMEREDAYKLRAAARYNYAIMVRPEKGDDFLINTLLNLSIPLIEKTSDTEKRVHYYSQLATLFMYNNESDKSATYHQKAIDLLEHEKPDAPTLLLAYLSATENPVQVDSLTQARNLLDKANAILQRFPESVNASLYYYQESNYYYGRGEYTTALSYLNEGIGRAETSNQFVLLDQLKFRKYDILMQQGKYREAKAYLTAVVDNGLLMAEEKNRRELLEQMARVNELLGNMPEAYRWLKAYSMLSDSINERQVQVNIHELETKYRTIENEKKISELEAENREADLAAKNIRLTSWFFGVTSVLLLIVALIAYFYYRNNQRLMAEKEQNHLQRLKEIEQAERIRHSQAIMKGEELERKRLAQDLHDGLGGLLAGVKIGLSGLAEESGKTVETTKLGVFMGRLDNASSELRRIAHNLMPVNLSKFGLEIALRDLCETLVDQQIAIDFQAYDIRPDIPEETQLHSYRLVQELLNNAVKHGRASEIMLQCSQDSHTLFITVEDNGIGFDIDNATEQSGMGLFNVSQRVAYLNGKIDIHTVPGEGTTINIELHV